MELRKTFRFEASHILPKHPGKCSRLHGHSWVLHVFVSGPVNPETGFVMDYADISKVVKPLVEQLDHRHLGQWTTEEGLQGAQVFPTQWPFGDIGKHCVADLPSFFYPSSENLLWWIGEQLVSLDMYECKVEPEGLWDPLTLKPGQVISCNDPAKVRRVSGWSKLALEETCTSYCELTREEFDARGR